MTAFVHCTRPACPCQQLVWLSDRRDEATPITPPLVGWECPRCHKVHAPHVSSCECRQTTLAGAGDAPVSAPKSWGRAN